MYINSSINIAIYFIYRKFIFTKEIKEQWNNYINW